MEMTPRFTTKASLCVMGNEVGELNTQGIDSWRTGVLIFLTQFFMHYSKRSKVWMLKAIASLFQFSGDECEVAIQILRRLLEENVGMCGEQMSLPRPGWASGCSRTGTMDPNRLVGSLGRNKPVGRSQNSTRQMAGQSYYESGGCSVTVKRVSNMSGLFTILCFSPVTLCMANISQSMSSLVFPFCSPTLFPLAQRLTWSASCLLMTVYVYVCTLDPDVEHELCCPLLGLY